MPRARAFTRAQQNVIQNQTLEELQAEWKQVTDLEEKPHKLIKSNSKNAYAQIKNQLNYHSDSQDSFGTALANFYYKLRILAAGSGNYTLKQMQNTDSTYQKSQILAHLIPMHANPLGLKQSDADIFSKELTVLMLRKCARDPTGKPRDDILVPPIKKSASVFWQETGNNDGKWVAFQTSEKNILVYVNINGQWILQPFSDNYFLPHNQYKLTSDGLSTFNIFKLQDEKNCLIQGFHIGTSPKKKKSWFFQAWDIINKKPISITEKLWKKSEVKNEIALYKKSKKGTVKFEFTITKNKFLESDTENTSFLEVTITKPNKEVSISKFPLPLESMFSITSLLNETFSKKRNGKEDVKLEIIENNDSYQLQIQTPKKNNELPLENILKQCTNVNHKKTKKESKKITPSSTLENLLVISTKPFDEEQAEKQSLVGEVSDELASDTESEDSVEMELELSDNEKPDFGSESKNELPENNPDTTQPETRSRSVTEASSNPFLNEALSLESYQAPQLGADNRTPLASPAFFTPGSIPSDKANRPGKNKNISNEQQSTFRFAKQREEKPTNTSATDNVQDPQKTRAQTELNLNKLLTPIPIKLPTKQRAQTSASVVISSNQFMQDLPKKIEQPTEHTETEKPEEIKEKTSETLQKLYNIITKSNQHLHDLLILTNCSRDNNKKIKLHKEGQEKLIDAANDVNVLQDNYNQWCQYLQNIKQTLPQSENTLITTIEMAIELLHVDLLLFTDAISLSENQLSHYNAFPEQKNEKPCYDDFPQGEEIHAHTSTQTNNKEKDVIFHENSDSVFVRKQNIKNVYRASLAKDTTHVLKSSMYRLIIDSLTQHKKNNGILAPVYLKGNDDIVAATYATARKLGFQNIQVCDQEGQKFNEDFCKIHEAGILNAYKARELEEQEQRYIALRNKIRAQPAVELTTGYTLKM